MTIRYRPERDITPAFLQRVHGWIRESSEVLVVLRYLCRAGYRDFALIDSVEAFDRLIQVCPRGTDIIVFRDPQLPLRGVADDDLMAAAQGIAAAVHECLLVELGSQQTGDPRLRGTSDSANHLMDDLRDLRGEPIAFGPCPAYWEEDNSAMISASKGGIDGPR